MMIRKRTKLIFLLFLLFLLCILIFACQDSINDSEDFQIIEVDIRMEVQILDKKYQLYSKPFTKIYFTTYKVTKDNKNTNYDQTDTTSCINGWGVKILNYTITDPNDKIILGASNVNYDGPNYKEIIIDYDEVVIRTDSTNHSSIIKTFAIYYE